MTKRLTLLLRPVHECAFLIGQGQTLAARTLTILIVFGCGMLLVCGCNSYKVTALPYDANLKGVVVVDNPKVRDGHFLPVLESAFAERGFRVRHGAAADAAGDEAVVTYSALRSWDIVPYLADADVVISKNGVQKASGHYHHTGGSLSLDVFTKWRGDEYKMADLYDQMLKNYTSNQKGK